MKQKSSRVSLIIAVSFVCSFWSVDSALATGTTPISGNCQDRMSASDPLIDGICRLPADCVAPATKGGSTSCIAGAICCVNQMATGSPDSSPTPVPPAAGTANPGGAATANRTTTAATTGMKKLYIPTSAETGLASGTITGLITNIMKWLLYIVGFVAVIAFLISGIQYLLAAGDESMASKAKENMQYAIIGVVVALSSLIIIRAIQAFLSGSWQF